MRTTGKKGKGKWIVIVVIAVFIIVAASNSGNDDTKNESKKVGSVTESSGSTSKYTKAVQKTKKAIRKTVIRKKVIKAVKTMAKRMITGFIPVMW